MRAFALSSVGFLTLTFLACSSGSSTVVDRSPTNPDGGPIGDSETPSAPLVAHPVCPTVATGEKLNNGCSGTGQDQGVCALTDPNCGGDRCIYDSRGEKFDFYCAPSCTPGAEEGCPLGFECVAQSAGCPGQATSVCARSKGFECDDSNDGGGTFFEGPNSETYRAKLLTGSRAEIGIKDGAKYRTIATLDGESYTPYVVVAKDRTLFAGAKNVAIVKGDQATVKALDPSVASNLFGTVGDSFVGLALSGEGFAALSRMNDDGTWTEVGPTRQRISNPVGLGDGFLARCKQDLCGSSDGENFVAVPLPEGARMPESGSFVAAGKASDDFVIVLGSDLFRHRRGEWVKEGPSLAAIPDGGGSYPPKLRMFIDGTIVFHSPDAKGRYDTFVAGESCWRPSRGGWLEQYSLVKGAFVTTSNAEGVCTWPIR